jgi:hypothetical protein
MRIDRARRPELVLAAAAAGFCAALAGVAIALGRVPLPVAVALLLAGGACGPALTGGLSSRLGGVVDEARLPRAFGLDSLSYNVAGLAGPALAAVVGHAASSAAAMLTLAGAAAAGAVVLAVLPLRSAPQRRPHPPSDWRDGLRLLARDRMLGVVTAASSVGQLGLGALPVVAAVMADRLGTASDGGLLITAMAAGGLLGSLTWTWRPADSRRAPLVVMGALAGAGLPLGLAAGTSSLGAATACFALSGACLGPFAGALFTTRQARAPEAVRAQIFTLGAGLKTTAAAGGAAAAGLLSGTTVAVQLLAVAAAPVVAAALGVLALATAR